jgi:uncharacterized protein YchJ
MESWHNAKPKAKTARKIVMDLSKTVEAQKKNEHIEKTMNRAERRRAMRSPCPCGSGKKLIDCCIDKVMSSREES